MNEILFRDKYRIPSTRLTQWDYGRSGWYFVTICTNGKHPFFGKIENGVMELSEMGRIATDELINTPIIRPYIDLDEWVIMPDHLHAIFILKQHHVGATSHVETSLVGRLPNKPPTKSNHWKSGTLGTIVNQYKRACTMRIRKIEPFFMWQSRYHDHIIRGESALNEIRQYIRDNPIKYGLKNVDDGF